MIAAGLATNLVEKWINGKLSFFINLRFSLLTAAGILLLLSIAAVGLHSLFNENFSKQDVITNPDKPSRKGPSTWLIVFLLPLFVAFLGLSTPVIVTVFTFVFIIGLTRLDSDTAKSFAENSHGTPTSLTTLTILAIPLIIATFVPIKPLSTSSLATRGISLSAPISLGEQGPSELTTIPDDRTVLDWVKIFNYESDITPYLGQTVDVIGFVYHDSKQAKEQFMVGRFAITCCVADAFAVGMVVDWPNVEDLAENSWVKVQGTLDETTYNDQRVPLIKAQSVTSIQAPEQPYLYP
jgi:putative membrane protein